jgi:short-subunit dehydrogenase
MSTAPRPFAIVTDASAGVGYHLARTAAEAGYDLLVAAPNSNIVSAAADFEVVGVTVRLLQADVSTEAGVDALCTAAEGRRADLLSANARHGLEGTRQLIRRLAKDAKTGGPGRVLLTAASDAGVSVAETLQAELKDSGVNVTWLPQGRTASDRFQLSLSA